jgi:hypothetical protein
MKIERKKLILIIAAIAAVLLTVGVIVLSMLTAPKEDETPVTPQVSSSPTVQPGTGEDDTPAQITNTDDPEAPPANMYENDYSTDVGYVPLPEGYVPSSDKEDNVFNPEWTQLRYYDIVCDLSKKETVSEKALKPMVDFYADLSKVNTPNTDTMRESMSKYIEKYRLNLGERAPGEMRADMSLACHVEDEE